MSGLTTEFLFIGIQVFCANAIACQRFRAVTFLFPGQIADAVSKMILR